MFLLNFGHAVVQQFQFHSPRAASKDANDASQELSLWDLNKNPVVYPPFPPKKETNFGESTAIHCSSRPARASLAGTDDFVQRGDGGLQLQAGHRRVQIQRRPRQTYVGNNALVAKHKPILCF